MLDPLATTVATDQQRPGPSLSNDPCPVSVFDGSRSCNDISFIGKVTAEMTTTVTSTVSTSLEKLKADLKTQLNEIRKESRNDIQTVVGETFGRYREAINASITDRVTQHTSMMVGQYPYLAAKAGARPGH